MTLRQLTIAFRVCGFLFLTFSAAMAGCGALDAAMGGHAAAAFVSSAILGGMLGAALWWGPPRSAEIQPRGVILSVCAAWLFVSLLSALPFALAMDISMVDALFEAASGLTTTGATVLTGLDRISPGVLFWRSLLQWLGGIGILAMGLVLLPTLGVGGMQISRMESSDVSEISKGQYRKYSRLILTIYLSLTILCAVAYNALGMAPFDAVNHAMTTLATGGYSTHDASFGHYADHDGLLIAGSIFMFLASLPFSLFVAVALMRGLDQVTIAQALLYVTIVMLLVVGCKEVSGLRDPDWISVIFNILSVLSTTGYASTDYQLWGGGVIVPFLLATFIGGCAGSTSGGVKVFRFIVLFDFVRTYLAKLIYPSIVSPAEVKLVKTTQAAQATVSYFTLFFLSLTLATAGLLAVGLDPVTAFTGSLTALSNVGPGFGPVIGPAGHFQSLPDLAKLVLTAAMIAGRLELLVVMALMHPVFWR